MNKEDVRLKVIQFEGYWCVVCPEGWYAPDWFHDPKYLEQYGLYGYPYHSIGYALWYKTLDFARNNVWEDMERVEE